jgi:beta-barrel assembly-enhancing protease
MRHNPACLTSLSLALCFASCATPQLETPLPASVDVAREADLQRKFAFDYRKDQRLLLARVAYKLAVSGAELCAEKNTGITGFWIWSASQYTGDDAEIARRHYGLGDDTMVMDVVEESPAYASGLRLGDRLVTLADFPAAPISEELLTMVDANVRAAFQAHQPISVVVSRDGGLVPLRIPLVPACDYEVRVNRDEAVNASADGARIVVNTGLLSFVKSEPELALVLSHELSHNFLGHVESQQRNARIGAGIGLVLGAVIAGATGVNVGLFRTGSALGARAYSVEFEQEADYAALYVMRRAGYDLAGVAEFWRRVAAQDTRQISLSSTHPTTAERFVGIETTLKEIKAKEEADQPLVPNHKPRQP